MNQREAKILEIGYSAKALMELKLEQPEKFTNEFIVKSLMEKFEQYGFKKEWENNAGKSDDN